MPLCILQWIFMCWKVYSTTLSHSKLTNQYFSKLNITLCIMRLSTCIQSIIIFGWIEWWSRLRVPSILPRIQLANVYYGLHSLWYHQTLLQWKFNFYNFSWINIYIDIIMVFHLFFFDQLRPLNYNDDCLTNNLEKMGKAN